MNLDRNYVRLNEFPEWFTVDENHLYRVRRASSAGSEGVWLGSELIAGIPLTAGEWIVEPIGDPPYGSASMSRK